MVAQIIAYIMSKPTTSSTNIEKYHLANIAIQVHDLPSLQRSWWLWLSFTVQVYLLCETASRQRGAFMQWIFSRCENPVAYRARLCRFLECFDGFVVWISSMSHDTTPAFGLIDCIDADALTDFADGTRCHVEVE
jgi:hypothetical protein